MHVLVLVSLLAAVPDAGAFSSSELGQQRAGENVTALDERWVEGLADGPLLVRVERHADDLALVFYARKQGRTDAGAPEFEERARFPIPQTRELDAEQVQPLGAAGEVLAVTTHADDPDEEPVNLTLVGKGPRLLFQGSFLRDVASGEPVLQLGEPEGFSLVTDGGAPQIALSSETKRVAVVRPDGGPGQVELGGHRKLFRWQSGKFGPAGDAYHDFLTPLRLSAPGHARLVDGKPRTAERLAPGAVVKVALPAGAKVRILRLVPGCLESEARAKREPAVREVSLQLDGAAPFEVELGKPVSDPRLFGAGEFTLGEGYGTSEMLFFAEPVAASTLTLTVKGKGGCLAELAAY